MNITKDIIARCKQKDEAAYKVIYQTCAPYVYAIIKNYLSEQEERKDMLQEVFAQIFLSIHRFDAKKGNFKPWVAKITANRCAVHLRSRNHLRVVFSMEEVVEEPRESLALLEQLNRADLEELLTSMPEGYRTVFLLNIIDGYTHEEISQLLKIKVQTSRSQLARAIKWIRRNANIQSGLLKLIGYGA
ncbi:MAG: sigma-70 family RNA polymerase sigma factor [Bacteroidota bacterium]